MANTATAPEGYKRPVPPLPTSRSPLQTLPSGFQVQPNAPLTPEMVAGRVGQTLLDALNSPIVPRSVTDAASGLAPKLPKALVESAVNNAANYSPIGMATSEFKTVAPKLGNTLAETAQNLSGQTNLEKMLAQGGDFSKLPKTVRSADEAAAAAGKVSPSGNVALDPYSLGSRLDKLNIPDSAKNLIVKNAEQDIAQTGGRSIANINDLPMNPPQTNVYRGSSVRELEDAIRVGGVPARHFPADASAAPSIIKGGLSRTYSSPDPRQALSYSRNRALSRDYKYGEPSRRPANDPSAVMEFDIEGNLVHGWVVDARGNVLEQKFPATRNIAFEKQRRGVVPDAAVDRKAQVLAEQLDIEQLSKTAPGTAFNAEDIRAIRKSIAQKATDLDILNTSIQEVGLKNATPDQQLGALKAALELNSLQRVGTGARAEAGRALRALSAIDDAIKSKTNAAYEKAFAAIGGRADAEAKIAKLQNIWNDASRPIENRERDIYNFVKTMDKASTGKKLEEFWLNSILSNPITHEINIIGNSLLMTAERLPARLAASTIEEALTLHGTLRPKAVTYTDTLVGAARMFTATRQAAKKALQYAKTGVSEADVNKFREAGTIGQTRALEGSAGAIINIPTRLLGVEDAFAYTMAYEGELAAQAVRAAQREGVNIFSAAGAKRVAELRATDAIKEAATKSADYVTLKTAPDQITEAILNIRRKVPGARFVLPFVQTPMNLVKRGFDYSPLGFTELFKKGLTQEDKALVAGRAVVGSAILAYFGTRVAQGEVTGPAPSDQKKRELFYDQGYRPFAIKVGNAWVEWGRFEPLATPIKWALAAKDVYDNTGEELSPNIVGPMLAAMGRALIDSTYLSGMSNFINALEDPAASGERTLSRIITGGVPFSGLLRGLAGVEDPYLRDPNGLVQRIEANLPGFSESVNPLLDILGDPITRPPSRQGIGAAVNPIVAEDRIPHPVILEDARLVSVFGTTTPGKTAEYTGIAKPSDSVAGIKLTADQQLMHEQMVGGARKLALSSLLASQQYQVADDVKKLDLWKKTVADSASAGRKQLGLQLAVNGDPNGAIIALANSPGNYDKGESLYVLQQGNALTPELTALLDSRRDPGDLAVADLLHGKELVDAYRKQPPFIAGDPAIWDTAKKARDQYMVLIKGMTADERKRSAAVQTFYNSAAGGWLRTLYDTAGSRNEKYVTPARKLIQQDKLWSHFSTEVSNEP